jgi:hypothetical protein
MRRRIVAAGLGLALAGCSSAGPNSPSDVNVVHERSAVGGCEDKGMISTRTFYMSAERGDVRPDLLAQAAARGGNTLLLLDDTFRPEARVYDCPRETVRTER